MHGASPGKQQHLETQHGELPRSWNVSDLRNIPETILMTESILGSLIYLKKTRSLIYLTLW